MGLFDKLFKSKAPAGPAAEPNTVYAPCKGEIIAQSDIPDPVFGQGVMGPGCGIKPAEETIYSPVDGVIQMIFPTKHAIGFTSNDGMEVLVHIGMDTVSMNGKGFEALAKEGQKVSVGTPVMKFSRQAIKDAGFTDVTAIVVTNGGNYASTDILTTGPVEAKTPVIKVSK